VHLLMPIDYLVQQYFVWVMNDERSEHADPLHAIWPCIREPQLRTQKPTCLLSGEDFSHLVCPFSYHVCGVLDTVLFV